MFCREDDRRMDLCIMNEVPALVHEEVLSRACLWNIEELQTLLRRRNNTDDDQHLHQ